MTAIELTMDDVQRDGEAVRTWLLAHDLEPTDTASGVVIRDGEVTATVWLKNADGKRYVESDPYDGRLLGVAHTVVVVPLRAPLPTGVGTVIE